jgi:predicted small metal-binding protein
MGVDCSWIGSAETVDEVLKSAAEHSSAIHDMKDILNEMMESMRRAVKET